MPSPSPAVQTTGLVAIAALAAPVVAGSIVALVAMWGQRGLARIERTQTRRADAYVALSDLAIRTRTFAALAHPDLDEAAAAPPFTDEEWSLLRARVEAFGSDRVVDLVDRLLTSRRRVESAVRTMEQAQAMQDPYSPEEVEFRNVAVTDLSASKAELRELCDSTTSQVRIELGSQRRRRLGRRSSSQRSSA